MPDFSEPTSFKSHNSFLWRQLTASGPSPNSYFLSPGCPPNTTSVRLPRHGILHAVRRAEPIGDPFTVQLRLGEPAASAVTVRQPQITDGNLTAPSATLGALNNCRELLSHLNQS